MQRDASGRGEDLSRVSAANSVQHEWQQIEDVLSDGENAKLVLVKGAQHVESEGAEVTNEQRDLQRDRQQQRDGGQRNVDHVWEIC